MSKKALKTLERENNILITSAEDMDARYSDDEFHELLARSDVSYTGVDWESREQFLKDNGYDVTRENMVDVNLSARQPSEE